MGRPKKSFFELSERSKRRKAKEVLTKTDAKLLTYATQMQLHAEGHRTASKLVTLMQFFDNNGRSL